MIVDERPSKQRRYLVPAIVFGTIAFCFMYCCSGMQWPMLMPQSQLVKHLNVYPGLTPLPASAKVIRAVRVAQNDSSEFYELEMPAADADAWKHALMNAVVGTDEEPAKPWTAGPSPSWFRPTDPNLTTQIEIYGQTVTQGYRIYFTPNTKTVLVCWFET